jgi:adenylylsulfate kinase
MDQPSALLITGTVGAGKTSVADALGDLLSQRQIPNAVIDLDWLRRSWPSPPGDPFNSAITLRNLRAVAANFLSVGAQRLVLAGVIESRTERDVHQAAVGVPLTVCRLQVDRPALRERLQRRHQDNPTALQWFLDRSDQLDHILRRAGVEDVVVDTTTRSVQQTASAIIDYPATSMRWMPMTDSKRRASSEGEPGTAV